MISPSKMAHFTLWLSRKGWKVVSKLPIMNLEGQREEPAREFYRNNTVKEYIPPWELGMHSVFWWPGHRPTFPPSPFSGEKKKKSPFPSLEFLCLYKKPVFCVHHHHVLWEAFSSFLRVEILRPAFLVWASCLGLWHTTGLLTEMVKWPWSLEPRCNPPAKRDQGWWRRWKAKPALQPQWKC